MSLWTNFVVKPGAKVDLSRSDAPKGLIGREEAEEKTNKNAQRIAEIQDSMYSAQRDALLLIFQGMDGSGKDGVIKKVLGPVNPAGVMCSAFKKPTPEELSRDFLWRAHNVVPPRGVIGVFNRSYYEDVIIVRVHADRMMPEHLKSLKNPWEHRYRQIMNFEALLHESRVHILKFFLNISKDEQRERFIERQQDPDKQHKLTWADIQERRYWDQYMDVNRDVIATTSSKTAPWIVVPSNQKWFRNAVVASAIYDKIKELDVRPPGPEDSAILKAKID